MNLSAPQTQASDNAIYFLYQALQDATKQNPLTDALFGKNSLTQWAKDREQDIQDANAIEAQDYLNKLDLDAITRAKNEGRDILSDYAKGRWFFDKNNEKVRAANAARDAAESKYIRDKLKASAVARANQNQLKGNDAAYLLNELGVKNRTTDEMNDYRSDVQSTWLNRNSPEMYRRIAALNFKDPTGASTRNFISSVLADNSIDSKNASDFLDENNVKPYMEYEADKQVSALTQKAAKANHVDAIKKLREDAVKYEPYSTKYNQFTSALDASSNRMISDAYNATFNDPDINAYIEEFNLTADEAQQVRINATREATGVSPTQIYKFLTGENAKTKAYVDSRTVSAMEDANERQAANNLSVGIKSLDDAYSANVGTYLFGNGALNVKDIKIDTSQISKIDNAIEINAEANDIIKNLHRVTGKDRRELVKNLSLAYMQQVGYTTESIGEFIDKISSPEGSIDFTRYLSTLNGVAANYKDSAETKQNNAIRRSRRYINFGRTGGGD